MPLTKCLRCEKLFNKTTAPICTLCTPAEDADFEIIRSCVNENPDINAEAVAKLTSVDIKCVLRMIESGNISTVAITEMGSDFKCGQCGAPAISASKKLCQSCLEKLNKKMMQTRQSLQMGNKSQPQVGEYNSTSVRSSLDQKRK
jgi:hypothetical protein